MSQIWGKLEKFPDWIRILTILILQSWAKYAVVFSLSGKTLARFRDHSISSLA